MANHVNDLPEEIQKTKCKLEHNDHKKINVTLA